MSRPSLLTDCVVGPAWPPAIAGAACGCCGAADARVCRCDDTTFPDVVYNPPGLPTIAYRVGDFAGFRAALLRPLPGERELSSSGTVDADGTGGGRPAWRPAPQGDLALQLVEWWAYLADVLTFYNERVANESYLNTARLPESVNRLIRTLGYRPRPGIGAKGTLAALVRGPRPPLLPAGFPIDSKPGPGEQPQTFELDVPVQLAAPDAVAVDPPPAPWQPRAGSLLLRGTVSAVAAGDELLLLPAGWAGADRNYGVLRVTGTSPEPGPRGEPNTRVRYACAAGGDLPAGAADPAGYRLLRGPQTAHVYQHAGGEALTSRTILVLATGSRTRGIRPAAARTTIGLSADIRDTLGGVVHLESLARQVGAGDPVLFADPSASPAHPPQPVSVLRYAEELWYLNNPSDPESAPTGGTPPPVPIPVLHTALAFRPALDVDWDVGTVVVRYGWRDAGTIIGTPAVAYDGVPPTLTAVPPAGLAAPPALPPLADTPVLIEDAAGRGAAADATVAGGTVHLSGLPDAGPPVDPPLVTPLRALFNLLPVSRGKTVTDEVLGGGDAGVAGQEFALRNAPVTYLSDPGSASGDGYASTVRVRVDGVLWREVPSLFGQRPDARVFVTREGDDGKTRVRFGDGTEGARLPSGAANVTATYRYGSGGAAPSAGTLTVVSRPRPGLAGVRNPVPPGGGADPEPPARVRRDAPRSVLAFGRAVSADDYQVIAAGQPGVSRARAAFAFDPASQRARVTVYVAGDARAADTVAAALAGAADPNRPADVRPAMAARVVLSATVGVDPARDPDVVLAAVAAALLDPDAGLFSPARMAVGQPLYESQIYAAAFAVPGVVGVHGLTVAAEHSTAVAAPDGPPDATLAARWLRRRFSAASPVGSPCGCRHRYDPVDPSYFFDLRAADLHLTPEVAHAG